MNLKHTLSGILSLLFTAIFVLIFSNGVLANLNDPLPSWNNTATKSAIIDFVQRISQKDSKDYVPPQERIATFDNDGTLWAEKPIYPQLQFALDVAKKQAEADPKLKEQEPFKSALSGQVENILDKGPSGTLELIVHTHTGMSSDEFNQSVKDWLAHARHPRFQKLYPQLVYKPMLELLQYMRDNGFKTYIVSGGGVDFIRPWTETTYGIPPEQVIASSVKCVYEIKDGKPRIKRLPEIQTIVEKTGKPLAINACIGRHPIASFGNSDGDLEMLQWTQNGSKPTLKVLVHHTDGEREWQYDRDSKVGHLDKALDEARAKGWTLIDMKNDWKQIFP